MSSNAHPLGRLSGWRKAKDSAANITITAGGLGVLGAILLIFFYLLYEVMPLFTSAKIEKTATYSYQPINNEPKQTLFMALEEQAEIALKLSDNGDISFFKAESGEPLVRDNVSLGNTITSYALNSEQNPLFVLGLASGDVILAKPKYQITYPNDTRLITPSIEYPYGEETIALGESALKAVKVRDSEEELLIVGVTEEGVVGKRYVKEEDFLTEEITLEEESISFPEFAIDVDQVLIGIDQREIYLVSKTGQFVVYSVVKEEVVDRGEFFENSTLTDIRFLLGGISLLVANDQGVISQWFLVSPSGEPTRLQKIRSFKSDHGIRKIYPEHRRKGFVTINEKNELDIFHSTAHRQLLNQSLADIDVVKMAISPRANALLVEKSDGEIDFWVVKNKHPEISWSVLWDKIWYESYDEPDYIWQSSAANNDFEPKFSFSPLAFGTLKAAFYAMLIATPLAICGAIYTAYFMSPVMRRKIKPLIELMEALPTVILGFLAGLWLAPFVESTLPGVFSVLIFMPIGVLVFAVLWSRLPDGIRLLVPDGWHAALLIPVVIFIGWACIAASPAVEMAFFGGDMRGWVTNDLGISYDQRNALVVGIAMGFAVIPTIFSIAEDAIFSVPKHLSYGSLALGATPWQTLVGVVMPTASPGIFSALMIGMGRAVGETMIVLMATGNTPVMDVNIFEGMRTLSANIAVEIGETEVDSSHYRVLFLAAFVLFGFTFVVNTAAEIVRQRLRVKYGSL